MGAHTDGNRDQAPTPLDLRSRVPRTAHGRPLLAYLVSRFPYHDEAPWREEIAAGRLWLDGRPAHALAIVRGGDSVLYRRRLVEPPVDSNLRVIHRERGFAVVDKPAHLPMHSAGPFVRNTLIHILRSQHGMPAATLVHRLDRETSGLVVVADDSPTRAELERQFRDRLVGKTYLAVVDGHLVSGRNDAPIGTCARSRIAIRRSAAPDAVEPQSACTEFEVVRLGARRSLVRCRPQTGRTHQIRVHLEQLGHPICGDRLYGHPDDHYLAFIAHVKAGGDPRTFAPGSPTRQLLHAGALTFAHPATGEPLAFESEPPPEFAAWLDATH